jgi:phosphate transport system permease protein
MTAAVTNHNELDDRPRLIVVSRGKGDRVFQGLALGSGLTSFLIVGGTFIFLALFSWPAVHARGLKILTTSAWNPASTPPVFGLLSMVVGTVLISTVALSIAFPVAFALAIFVHEYAPTRLRRPMIYTVDMMAALPSLIYGIWGFFVLQKPLKGVARWLGENMSAIPLFRRAEDYSQSMFIAGVVVGVMILPICTSVMREIFSQVPPEHCEAALALGGTRWGMVRVAIIPFSRSGMVGAALLGLGRALGETVAVSLIIAVSFQLKGTSCRSAVGPSLRQSPRSSEPRPSGTGPSWPQAWGSLS